MRRCITHSSLCKRTCMRTHAYPWGCRHVPGNIFKHKVGPNIDLTTNELVIRIQPRESIYLKINNKVRACAHARGCRLVWGLPAAHAMRWPHKCAGCQLPLFMALVGPHRLWCPGTSAAALPPLPHAAQFTGRGAPKKCPGALR